MTRGEYLGRYAYYDSIWLMWRSPSGDLVGIPERQFKKNKYDEMILCDPVNGKHFIISLPVGYWEK